MGGSSPKTTKQEDPQVTEDKAKKKALALSQAYEAKAAAMGTANTKLNGTQRNTQPYEQTDTNQGVETNGITFPLSQAWRGAAKQKEMNAQGKAKGAGALTGFDSYTPISTEGKTAADVYEKSTTNQRNEMSAELEYTRRKRQVLGAG